MIEVNLLPGSTGKRASRRPKIAALGAIGALSNIKGVGGFDRLTTAAIAAWLIMVPLTLYMFISDRNKVNDLNASVEGAVADSTKYANIIAANKRLLERRDTIARKVSIIQSIDAGRYVWPHIMDEISRAL